MRFYRLRFPSALHVDSRGSGAPESIDEHLRSDTLSAALCLAWSAIFEKDKGVFLKPPFLVSSAFPYIDDIFLFPVPAWPIWEDASLALRKQVKSIHWLSEDLFRQLLDGRRLYFRQCVLLPGGLAVSEEEAACRPALKGRQVFSLTERQRVLVDRFGVAPDGGLFFFALQFFDHGAGLYFLADGAPSVLPKLRAALTFLGDSGLGADRNSGLGHFTILDEGEINLGMSAGDGGWMTLSLFNPGADDSIEDLTERCAYKLTTRSGWISGSTMGRAPVRVFGEGAFFASRPKGRILPTLPTGVQATLGIDIGHEAPRDFRALAVPCAMPQWFKEQDHVK